jgi:uncharacterized protein
MPDHIRYDLLTQQALRSVVRNVLGEAAKKGLPGEHHFYISFDTKADGVRLSERLRAQYPEQMTVILQHQFWDLEVDDTGFGAGLSFGGVPEKLYVPFESIKGFFDPSVQFGLQFEEASETEEQPGGEAVKSISKKLPPVPPPEPAPAPVASSGVAGNPDDPNKPTGGAEVVRLDRFRKK